MAECSDIDGVFRDDDEFYFKIKDTVEFSFVLA